SGRRGSRWTWERAKLTSAFEVGQVRRFGEVALLASLAATGCGSWQRVGTTPRPQPGTALPSLADAGSLYRGMGFLVAGPPLPFYQGAGRSRVADLPQFLVNPRATLPYGADTLRFYIEAYGLPPGIRLAARGLDQSGAEVAHDTVALGGDGRFAAAQFAFRPGELSVGEGSVEIAALVSEGGASPAVRAHYVLSF